MKLTALRYLLCLLYLQSAAVWATKDEYLEPSTIDKNILNLNREYLPDDKLFYLLQNFYQHVNSLLNEIRNDPDYLLFRFKQINADVKAYTVLNEDPILRNSSRILYFDKRKREVPQFQFLYFFGADLEKDNNKYFLFITNKEKLISEVNHVLDFRKILNPNYCFILNENQFELKDTNKKCYPFIERFCSYIFNAKSGSLYYRKVDENLKIENQSVDLKDIPDHLTHTNKQAINSLGSAKIERHLFCEAAARSGMEFSSKMVFTPETEPNWLPKQNSFDFTIDEFERNSGNYLEKFKEACVNNVPNKTIEERLNQLMNTDSHPKFYSWQSAVKSRKWECQNAVNNICSSIHQISGKYIYTYQAKSKNIRSVTADDVLKDIDDFRRRGLEEASVLEHSTLYYKIIFCSTVKNLGFDWTYYLPKEEVK